jgi:hypothetical protein
MKGAIFQYFFYRDKKNRPLKKGPFLKRPFFPRKLPLEKGPFLKRPFFPTTIQWTIYRQYSTYTNLLLGPGFVDITYRVLQQLLLRCFGATD